VEYFYQLWLKEVFTFLDLDFFFFSYLRSFTAISRNIIPLKYLPLQHCFCGGEGIGV
jgi:hypothetical protein